MTKSKDLAIVLVSGGMDSLTVAAMAHEQYENLAFLHMNYGQKTSKKERECFEKIADFYKIPSSQRKIIDMTFLSQIGGSSLTDQSIEVSKYVGDSDQIPSSYVPFRNTHIIAMAVSWAEVIGAKKIFIGANYEDSPGYPDCRPSYYEAYNQLIKQGTKEGNIEIETPIIMMKKSQIVAKAVELHAPLELSWSCYARADFACGVCDSCALRLRGFKEFGLKDPIPYIQEK
jgi:7-cyano-7-deazaguanine synthase